jgi:Fe-S oxidoreductase
MFDPQQIIELIAHNVRKTRNPFGVSSSVINTWWRGLPLRREGDALLFTGLMYQSVPYIEHTTRHLARLEDTYWARTLRFGRLVPSFLVGLGFRFMASPAEKQKYNGMVRDIHKILVKSNVDFFYRPDLDHYSGILLYDLGDEEGFSRHAAFVANRLKASGVRKLITVDPHTTYAMKVLIPKYTGESFEVKTYFELANITAENGSKQVTLHDPCFYGRYLELSDAPRKVIANLGIEHVEVRNSGTFTSCCGGPAESVSPKLTAEVLGRRVAELKATGAPVVAMCPICLGNLLRAGVQAEDLSTLVARYA